MDRRMQLTFDALDPRALGTFWAHVLGYVEEPAPDGFADWEAALRAWGMPEERWNDGYAIVDPAGAGPRVFLQRVPEGKSAKNRVHLDVGLPGAGPRGAEPDRAAVRARAAELADLGAQVVREFDEPGSGYWIVLLDPEGNEFCLV
ncbi:VOC family protein [Cellulomonas shaoxiangyii]|uniref:VOC family protein n=1 Tax=Cellulomonas shaoxiangyii TaxID=2566013 RepID=A0A4P7SHN8_9CELL|nr:VOC family protein [Cellulomonas shaoxiangyii]QCB93500.1 VOC family protein [Cellulomonas shaoxiangyii]TGY86822.1 VOC family protein [Cellulomonas shaoxiangyii]